MAVRQRIPFKLSDDFDDNGRILDEQEQEVLIEDFRSKSAVSNSTYEGILRIVIGISCILHIIYIMDPSKTSPFSILDLSPPSPIPFPTVFAFLHILLHLNLGLHLLPTRNALRDMLTHYSNSHLNTLVFSNTFTIPLSFNVTFVLSLPAPVLALVLRRGWSEGLWWSVMIIMVAMVYSIKQWILDEERSLRELDKLRYDAKGA